LYLLHQIEKFMSAALEYQETDDFNLSNLPGGDDQVEEGDWDDEEDEDFEDEMETRNDMNEIRVDDDLLEPDPEDDDHLPDDDLQ